LNTPDPTDPPAAPEPEQKVNEAWSRLSRRQQLGYERQQRRRQERRQKRDAFVAIQGIPASGTTGYCCPKCHRWFTTTEERAACRASHPQEQTT
jgi:hypothetical protein